MPTSAPEAEKTLYCVLLAVSGLSPQVIARTQSYLQRPDAPQEIPAAVRLFTAEDGQQRLELKLNDQNIHKLHEFMNDCGEQRQIDFSIQQVKTPHDGEVPDRRDTQVQTSIRIDVFARRLMCGNKEVFLSPQLFAWYVWMAKRCLQGQAERRCVRWTDADIADEFLREYRKVVGTMTHYYEKAACLLAGGMTQEFFQEKKARVNRRLQEVLQAASEPYLIKATGRRPTQKFGLFISANCIEIV